MMRHLLIILVAAFPIALSSCSDKPKHYLVLCDAKDGKDWQLTNVDKDTAGYIKACTYTAPDKSDNYTRRCTNDGCNIE